MSVPGGIKVEEDPSKIISMAAALEGSLREVVKTGLSRRGNDVRKALSPSFASQYGLFLAESPFNMGSQLQQLVNDINSFAQENLGKSFTTSSPLSSGLAPFDLSAPTRLLYPYYAPMRNKIPRVPGQGLFAKVKNILSIAGSQTGSPVQRVSISEFPSGQNFSNWPLQLPPQGAQTAVDFSIPYKFWGLTEAVSMLAQLAAQGFDDLAGLANLILIQEFTMAEEYAILAATSTNITTPAAPTTTTRVAGAGETALTGSGGNNLYIRITETTFFGETTSSPAHTVTSFPAATHVLDVFCVPTLGMQQYNVYVGVGTADPGLSGSHLIVQGLGGIKVTLQGVIPTATATPPTADTGTGASTDDEGMISVLSGHASTDAAVYPSQFQGGYVNQVEGVELSSDVMNTSLEQLFLGPNAFRANPSEAIGEGSDLRRLADDVVNTQAANLAYRINIDNKDVGDILGGAAVSQFLNPITRDPVKLLVHPWFTQGTVIFNSYTLPQPQTNVSNVWEKRMVQDYLSISWPQIDVTWRFSIFMYGALVANAPMYCGLIQGLQRHDSTPYS